MLFIAERLGIPPAPAGADVPPDAPVLLEDVVVLVVLPDPLPRGPHGFGNGCVFSVPACPSNK